MSTAAKCKVFAAVVAAAVGLLALLAGRRIVEHAGLAFSIAVMYILLPFIVRREAEWWKPVVRGLAGMLIVSFLIGLRGSPLGVGRMPVLAQTLIAGAAAASAGLTLWSALRSLESLSPVDR